MKDPENYRRKKILVRYKAKKKGLRLLPVTTIFYPKNNIANNKHINNKS